MTVSHQPSPGATTKADAVEWAVAGNFRCARGGGGAGGIFRKRWFSSCSVQEALKASDRRLPLLLPLPAAAAAAATVSATARRGDYCRVRAGQRFNCTTVYCILLSVMPRIARSSPTTRTRRIYTSGVLLLGDYRLDTTLSIAWPSYMYRVCAGGCLPAKLEGSIR